jgi:hypothetical protein
VTVGRQTHKVKPNAKKRMNLRALAHPNSIGPAARLTGWKPCAIGCYERSRAEFGPGAEHIFPHKQAPYVTEITSCYALCTVAETR